MKVSGNHFKKFLEILDDQGPTPVKYYLTMITLINDVKIFLAVEAHMERSKSARELAETDTFCSKCSKLKVSHRSEFLS